MPAMVISGTSLSGAGGCGTMSRMRAELTRFRVLPGHSAVVEEWMAFLRRHEAAVRETLPAEKMHVESVFTETVDGVQYLYWYSVQGEGGASVADSTHWLDRVHLDYWDRCIDPDYPPQDLTLCQHVTSQEVEAAARATQ